MVTLEYFSNLSSALDFILLLIMAAGVFYGLKVKFVGEARKAASEAKAEAITVAEGVDEKVLVEHQRINNLENRINSVQNDIAWLKGRHRDND